MGAFARAHAADDRALIHQLGQFGHVLANLNARGAGLNRFELAGAFAFRLQVPGVLVTRSAGLPEQDHRLDFALRHEPLCVAAAGQYVEPARIGRGEYALLATIS